MDCDRSIDDKNDIKISIRKLRKRLRQIECLEKVSRPLTAEETYKVKTKEDCRESLQSFLVLAEQFEISDASCLLNEEHVNYDDNHLSQGSIVDTKFLQPEKQSELTDGPKDISSEVTPINIEEKASRPGAEEGQLDESSLQDNRKRKRVEVSCSGRAQVIQKEQYWSNCSWITLNGHHDNICCVDVNESLMVSASKDTTCRLWQCDGVMDISLGDHTSSVTGVFFMSDKVVTTSYDCKLRIWNIQNGKLEHTQYLYSPITVASYLGRDILLGTEGGKLILYCLSTFAVKWEMIAHREAVSCVRIHPNGSFAASASTLPDMKLWRFSESGLVLSEEHVIQVSRDVRCLMFHCDLLYFGDDGVNLKLYDMKTKSISKLRNHENDYGSTDAVMVLNNDTLVSSSYDLDSGQPSLNFRSLPDHAYMFTIHCPLPGPITCLSWGVSPDPTRDISHDPTRDPARDSLFLFCGGSELGILSSNGDLNTERVEVSSLPGYRDRYSDSESSSSASDDSETQPSPKHRRSGGDSITTTSGSGQSWCTVS